MEILLLVVVVGILMAFVIRAWKSYETEVRKGPAIDGSKSLDTIPFADFRSTEVPHYSGHPGGIGCPDTHHTGCDAGVHGGYDAGHSGFEGGSHH